MKGPMANSSYLSSQTVSQRTAMAFRLTGIRGRSVRSLTPLCFGSSKGEGSGKNLSARPAPDDFTPIAVPASRLTRVEERPGFAGA